MGPITLIIFSKMCRVRPFEISRGRGNENCYLLAILIQINSIVITVTRLFINSWKIVMR